MNRAKLADRYQTDGLAITPPQQLLVRLYERLERDLVQAADAATIGLIEETHRLLVHAQDIVYELDLALDTDAWPEGQALKDLYAYLADRLIQANLRKSPVIVNECLAHVRPLVQAWQAALTSNQRDHGAVAAVGATAGTYTA